MALSSKWAVGDFEILSVDEHMFNVDKAKLGAVW